MTTVYLADDHEMILPGIKMTVESLDGFSVVGQATDGMTAVREMLDLKPDLCVIDLSIPLLNGFGITRKLMEAEAATRVILLTSYSDDEVIQQVLQHQISGYILKENNSRELENALINVAKGYRYFSPKIMTRMADELGQSQAGSMTVDSFVASHELTSREKDILSLVADGLSGKDICEALHISASTMKTHKSNLLKKMNVKTTGELILLVNKNSHPVGF